MQVVIKLYGEQEEVLGSTLDNVAGLRAGETWRFRAVVLHDGVASYRVDDISAY